jgi:site-specific recombinase XerD
MKYDRKKDKNFWQMARKYLHEYMPLVRNLSDKSVEAYKQSLNSYIGFLKENKGFEDPDIIFDSFSRAFIIEYIELMKKDGYAPKSINLRLTAIRSFLKYCGEVDFELKGVYADVCSIKKKKEEKRPIVYLPETATAAILSAYGVKTSKHRRNRMLLILLYDTGARIQELSNLNVSSLHLDAGNPFITLMGKGRKTRNVPLLNNAVAHLQIYLKEFHPNGMECPLFYCRLDGMPHRLSTDSISLILKNAADVARKICTDVPDNVHCHMIRKTKAMDLYKSGIPLPFIMQLLGHESMSTTSGFYAFATLEMMSEAMEKSTAKIYSTEKLWKQKDARKLLYSLD